MKNEVINLKDLYNVKGGTLTSYCGDFPFDRGSSWKRPAVIVVPGGAYCFCSKREEEPIAFEFLARGYNVFVLEYLVKDDNVGYPEQLLELASAVDYVKKNAKKYSINPKEVFAVGFSAGGHLVACLSSDYTISQKEYGERLDSSLTAAGLIYPVISFDYIDDKFREFLPTRSDKLNQVRTDKLVGKNTVPAFIFSTYMDKTVPSINAIKYAEAMAENNIPYELHIYKNGDHGMSSANAEINERTDGISRNRNWLNDCAEFFRDYVKEKF